jgi:uncharacterized membrane protein YcaP (DUF421 family)
MFAQSLHNMFVLDPSAVTIAEKIIRPIIVYVFLVIGLRLAGKRELAQINPFDLVVLMTLSNTVQNAIIGNDNSVSGGVLGAATLLAINYGVVRLIHKHRKIGRFIEGHAQVLVRDGKVEKEKLEREMITKEELQAAAHRQGIMSLHEVEQCKIEPNGTITFVQKTPTPEATRQDAIVKQLTTIVEHLTALRSEQA